MRPAPSIDAAGQQLTVKFEGERLTVMGDLVRLSQVVTNLLNNASKYTPAGGRIDLRLYQQGKNAVISVADTGIGIPPEMSNRIFDMFVQLQPYAPRAKSGLGVGLALSRRLIELHGGSIEVQSDGKDRGERLPRPFAAAGGRSVRSSKRSPVLRRAGAGDHSRGRRQPGCRRKPPNDPDLTRQHRACGL